jgi:hypothetical protein
MTIKEAEERRREAYSNYMVISNNDTFAYTYEQEKEAWDEYLKADEIYQKMLKEGA